jgi:hypothetical protein
MFLFRCFRVSCFCVSRLVCDEIGGYVPAVTRADRSHFTGKGSHLQYWDSGGGGGMIAREVLNSFIKEKSDIKPSLVGWDKYTHLEICWCFTKGLLYLNYARKIQPVF